MICSVNWIFSYNHIHYFDIALSGGISGWLPAEKYDRMKLLCKNIALLALEGSAIQFLHRYALLKELCDAWTRGYEVHITYDGNNVDDRRSSRDGDEPQNKDNVQDDSEWLKWFASNSHRICQPITCFTSMSHVSKPCHMPVLLQSHGSFRCQTIVKVYFWLVLSDKSQKFLAFLSCILSEHS